MKKIFIPTSSPESWSQLLADPVKHWRPGYSAHSLACAWEAENGKFPPEVEQAFSGSSDERLTHLKMLMAFPEYKVYLPPRGHASQNDLFVLARNEHGLAAIVVEGKVDEAFGPTLEGWLKLPTPGKLTRLDFIQSKLGLSGTLPGTIRYQLLHRTVSALVEAERFQAKTAVMLVHSFSPHLSWFSDYACFLGLFGTPEVRPGVLYLLGEYGGISLFAGWAHPRILDTPQVER